LLEHTVRLDAVGRQEEAGMKVRQEPALRLGKHIGDLRDPFLGAWSTPFSPKGGVADPPVEMGRGRTAQLNEPPQLWLSPYVSGIGEPFTLGTRVHRRLDKDLSTSLRELTDSPERSLVAFPPDFGPADSSLAALRPEEEFVLNGEAVGLDPGPLRESLLDSVGERRLARPRIARKEEKPDTRVQLAGHSILTALRNE
jgi:hypothetical protein